MNTPPLDRMPIWFSELGLQEGSQEWLRAMQLAAIAHIPDPTAQQQLVDVIENQDKLEARIARLESRLK